MKKIKEFRNKYWLHALLLGAGLFLGWLFFHSPGDKTTSETENLTGHEGHEYNDETGTIWTCSMHPRIRQDKPGKCPICAMDLVPVSSLESEDSGKHPDEIQLTESAAKLADIQTIVVRKGSPEKEIFLQGKVQEDERKIAELTARFGGRIEKLFVSFTGENVTRDQKLATIYSPELVTAQKELLEAISYRDSRPSIYNAARAKLRLWDLTEGQIDGIENNGEPKSFFDILSPISGTVTKRNIALGDYVREGSTLFEVTDFTHVWIMFDAYESDLPWIKNGDRVSYTVQSFPGKKFQGKVDFIDPFIDPSTRIARVRIEQSNPSLTLKPGMFVNGMVESTLAGRSKDLLIPKSSILWTGKRAVVYVKIPERESPSFLYREITLGPEAGSFYLVAEGLMEGEEIAVNGVFKIDAAAQLEGKPSMMNPVGGEGTMAHDHISMAGMSSRLSSSQPEMSSEDMSQQIDPAFQKQLQEGTIYYQYCHMADNNKGAFWLSEIKEIRNPYFGDQMLNCGETRETIEFK